VDEEVIQKLEMTILSSLHFSSIQSNIGGGKSGKVSSFSISYPHGGYGQERREGGRRGVECGRESVSSWSGGARGKLIDIVGFTMGADFPIFKLRTF